MSEKTCKNSDALGCNLAQTQDSSPPDNYRVAHLEVPQLSSQSWQDHRKPQRGLDLNNAVSLPFVSPLAPNIQYTWFLLWLYE